MLTTRIGPGCASSASLKHRCTTARRWERRDAGSRTPGASPPNPAFDPPCPCISLTWRRMPPSNEANGQQLRRHPPRILTDGSFHATPIRHAPRPRAARRSCDGIGARRGGVMPRRTRPRTCRRTPARGAIGIRYRRPAGEGHGRLPRRRGTSGDEHSRDAHAAATALPATTAARIPVPTPPPTVNVARRSTANTASIAAAGAGDSTATADNPGTPPDTALGDVAALATPNISIPPNETVVAIPTPTARRRRPAARRSRAVRCSPRTTPGTRTSRRCPWT